MSTNKKITTVLFDLDGTLLPMDQDTFVKAYFGGLSKKLLPYGYEPEKLIGAIWQGTKAMVMNDGKQSNEQIFWDEFCSIFGEAARNDETRFERFYIEDFDKVQTVCGFDKRAKEAVDLIKSLGFRVSLATNPIFPSIATEKRIKWAGLEPTDFEHYTTYENSRFCKPNPRYYMDILDRLGVSADECLMVGNDVAEDMVAGELGMKVFLLTDCLINKKDADISVYPRGSFDELIDFVKGVSA